MNRHVGVPSQSEFAHEFWRRGFFYLVLAHYGAAHLFAVEIPSSAAKSANESLACIQCREGFRVELVAAEPLVRDPIAIAWGKDASVWVVEMGDYPTGANRSDAAQPGGLGRICRLTDTDADGRFDTSQVFLDDLNFPTGVMEWREGVLVTCAPAILYAEDTDLDGRADLREVLFTGFIEGNPQHRVNGPCWGLDNWIHLANGGSGGMITSIKTGRRQAIDGHDIRIDPDTGRLGLLTGMSEFGRCRDDWGNWFGGNSDWPFWHNVLEDEYLIRNRYLRPPESRVHLMNPPANAPVFPISDVGRQRGVPAAFTSACGPAMYRDELFGPNFSHSYFVCEPEHNLIHHEDLQRCGVTFTSARPPAEQNAEFLASSDPWFRPTQVSTGPDGSLWIVDMYRQVIEHPEFIRDEWRQKLDGRAGAGMGRIYRVFPADRRPRRTVRLDRLQPIELVEAMDTPNGPQRDLAQRLLVEQRNSAAIAPLEMLALRNNRPTVRLTALSTLAGMNAIRSEILLTALRDSHPAIRRQAIRLCESRGDKEPMLQQVFLDCVDDPDLQVRLQLACSLGEWNDGARAAGALARLITENAGDPYLAAAAISSATKIPDELLAIILRTRPLGPTQVACLKDLLRMTIAAPDEGALAHGITLISRAENGRYETWQFELVGQVLDDLEMSGMSLVTIREHPNPDLQAAVDRLEEIFRNARQVVADERVPLPHRLEAVRLLGRGCQEQEADTTLLESLLAARNPGELQRAAAKSLGNLAREDLPTMLLADWRRHGPELQSQVIDVLLSRPEWTLQLLERIETRQIVVASLGAAHRAQLTLHSSADVRRRWSQLVDSSRVAGRAQMVEVHRNAVRLVGDPRRGEPLFWQHCAACHRWGKRGYQVGPDLHSLAERSPSSLLISLLDPNRSVEPRYQAYVAATNDGRVFTGILSSENGNSITLTAPLGVRHMLLRAELMELQATGKSLMPEGLESLLPDSQALADLMQFLSGDPSAGDPSAGDPPTAPATTADRR